MAATTVHKIQVTTALPTWNNQVTWGTTTTKYKQTTTQAQAQQQQPIQGPIPLCDT